MALSAQKSSKATLHTFLRWAVANGYSVGENLDFGTRKVTAGVHAKGSWHYDNLAADLNHGANGANERAKLLTALAKAQSLGLAVIFAKTGTVGAAKNHQNHLHVDVGSWSNIGQGNIKASVIPLPKPAPNPSGNALAQVQARLNRDYPAYSKLVVDGVDGPRTQAVVKEFQRRAGLVVDGIAGPATRAKLGL